MVTSWENTTLENITSVITKGTTPTSIGKSFTLTGINFIKIECIDKSGQFDKSMFEHIDVETNNILKRSQLNDGDILFSIAGALGRIAIVDERVLPANTNQALAIIRLKKASDAPNRRYVYYQLQSEKTKRIIEEINVSGAQANLSLDNISNLIIPIPEDVKEQERIAEALSDVDSMISSLEKLIAKKEAIKQGAMQELLTGKKRLPGFDGEWEHCYLSQLGIFIKGSGISRDESNSGTLLAVRYGELYTKHNNYITKFYSHISEDVANDAKRIYYGDILFAASGETKEEIGKCAAIVSNEEVYAGGDILIFRPFNDLNPLFMGTVLNMPEAQKQRAEKGQGDAVVHIHADDLGKMSVYIPEFEEQTAIASVLSDMDNEIEALEQKLTKTRQLKQGMMQQLLTGKIRLV